MNVEEIIEKLQVQLDTIPSLQSKNAQSPEFKKWNQAVCNNLDRLPQKATVYRKQFGSFRFHDVVLSNPPHRKLNHVKCYQEGMLSTQVLLESIIEELREYPDDFQIDEPVKQNALAIIENVCNKFHLFVKNLHEIHHANQEIKPITVSNEYDVQHLLQSILSLFFDDIRPEEPGKKRAGSSSRADFWLFQEKILIECKYIKNGFTNEKLKGQLDRDVLDYQTKDECRAVVFFIYDPISVIDNPRGFETDYNRIQIKPFGIKTLIRPTMR